MQAYDGAIGYIDQQIGILLDELGSRGLLENTLIIVTSDHGELFGEHELYRHGNGLYRNLLHVPLVMSFPSRIPPNTSVVDYVTLRDLPATILDVLGLDKEKRIPGHSLARVVGESSASIPGATSLLLAHVDRRPRCPSWYRNASGPLYSILQDGFFYVQDLDGSEELYDWINDPGECTDLAQLRAHRTIVERARQSISDAMNRV